MTEGTRRDGWGPAVALLAALLPGCHLFIEFDPSLLDRDGGVDAGPDGGADAGEEDCDREGDEDGNGLADCDDFACVGAPQCCDADDPVDIVEDWAEISEWSVLPTEDPDPPDTEPGRLTGFGVGTFPRAVLRKQCVPLVAGLAIDVTFAPRRDGACVGPEPCDAGLVLTAASDMTPGERLLDELSVRVTRGGGVDVRQGGALVAAGPAIPVDARVDVAVDLGPGFDAEDRAVIAATVSVRVGSDEARTLVDGFPVTRVDDLVDVGIACADTPGLFVAVEGRGAQIDVEPLSMEVQACLNPSIWEVPRDAPEALTVPALSPGPWAGGGGLLAPALATSADPLSPGSLRWDLLFAGTDVPPDLERDTRVGFSVGHGVARGAAGWAGAWAFRPSPSPKMGDCHPACLGEVDPACAPITRCPSSPSLRDPFVLPLLDEDDTLQLLQLAYAVELDPVDRAHGIGAVVSFPLDPTTPFDPPAELLTPTDLADGPDGLPACDALRDPALAPAEPGPLGHRWLFFTCERRAGLDEIRAVRLSPSMVLEAGTEARVVDPMDPAVSGHGAGGVRAPEVLVDFDGDGRATVRLWYLARRVPGAPTTLSLAQGVAAAATGEEGSPADLPPLVPYPGNPVLQGDDPIFGPCAGDCALIGAAVSRIPALAGRLRFLLARRLDDGDLVTYELRPLEQIGRARR